MKIAAQKHIVNYCSSLCELFVDGITKKCKYNLATHDIYGLQITGPNCPLYHGDEYEEIEKDVDTKDVIDKNPISCPKRINIKGKDWYDDDCRSCKDYEEGKSAPFDSCRHGGDGHVVWRGCAVLNHFPCKKLIYFDWYDEDCEMCKWFEKRDGEYKVRCNNR